MKNALYFVPVLVFLEFLSSISAVIICLIMAGVGVASIVIYAEIKAAAIKPAPKPFPKFTIRRIGAFKKALGNLRNSTRVRSRIFSTPFSQ